MTFNKMDWLAAIRATVALKTEVKWTNQAGKAESKKFNMTHAAVAYDLAEQYATWGTGEGIWVSKATLADQWGASRTGTIIPTFNMLEALGFIKEDPSQAKGESRYYDLTMPKAMPDDSLIKSKIAERQAKRAEEKRNQRAEQKEALEAYRAQKAAVEPAKEEDVPQESQEASEPEKAVEEPYEISTNLSWGEGKTDEEILAADVFVEDEPVEIAPGVEKPETPKAPRKAKKTTEKVDPLKAMMDAAKRRAIFHDEFVARRLSECDNPEKAQRLFDDPTWEPSITDRVARAASAAFEVEGEKVKV